MVYKTKLYIPVNQIINTKRTNGNISEEEIDYIIEKSYRDLIDSKSSNIDIMNTGNYTPNIGILDENGNIVPYIQFKEIILNTIKSLESSLKSITIDEPITVYRGLSTNDIEKKEIGFLSTTIDINIALSFLDSLIRPNKGNSVLYKITLLEGSPINFYSTELFTGKIDDTNNNPFADRQKEILIDADNFEFEVDNIETIHDANIKEDSKTLYLISITAKPKIKIKEQAECKTL